MATKETLIHLMRARKLINPVLAVLVVVVSLLLWTGNNDDPRQGRISDMDAGSVQQVQVERTDEPDLIFKKKGTDWFLTEPVSLLARPARIDAILGLAHTRSLEQLNADGADLATLHLAPPLLSVRLDGRAFHFGTTDPIKNRRYILEGETIHLVEDRLYPQLTQPVSFFTHTRLLPDEATITQITYPGHTLFLDGDRWHSRPGPVLPGTETAAVVENWRRAEAGRVLLHRESDTAGKVVIKTEERVTVFAIIRANHGLLLARPDLGIRYQLSAETAANLGLADYLRE